MRKILGFFLFLLLAFSACAGFLVVKGETIVVQKIRKDFWAVSGTEVILEGTHLTRRVGGDFKLWRLTVQKAKVKNTPGFKIPNMAEVKNVELVFEPLEFLRGRWRIRALKAFLSKTSFEINGQGELNISKLAVFQPSKAKVPSVPDRFSIARLEWMYGTLYYSNFQTRDPDIERYDFKKRVAVFDRVSDPSVLFEAPLLEFINQLNKGSMGFSRGKIQENVTRHIG